MHARSTTLASVLAAEFQRFACAIDEGTYAYRGGLVTDRYFETLGVRLAMGRTFTERESGLDSGSGLVAIVSDRVWADTIAR